ncbi:MAG: pyridoxal-phosphate dependent enzyme [Acidimicrobiia bacterium]|nr:pyridoxal-phosphate dependent enzyme [Acidimicrobiia bacterium]
MPPDPTLSGIRQAATRIADLVVHTPIVDSPGLGDGVGLKLEALQPTGSFKVRGAANRILQMSETARRRGVVTASTGNHGRAVAHVAARLGIPAAICLSEAVPAGKVASLEELQCELVIGGTSQDEAMDRARSLAERGMTLVHPFDDPHVIAGQGTVALEILADRPDTATVLVPLSGGGLAAGTLVAIKTLDPSVRVTGVCMERAAVMAASLRAGAPVEMPEQSTLADSLQGGIGLDNSYTFRLVRDLIDDVVLLTEPEIWAGMRYALEYHRIALEGGAAVGIGAILAGKVDIDGGTVIVCTGANLERRHLRALAEELDTASA